MNDNIDKMCPRRYLFCLASDMMNSPTHNEQDFFVFSTVILYSEGMHRILQKATSYLRKELVDSAK